MLFEKLVDEATLPTRATKGSAGYDLHCIEDVIVRPVDWTGSVVKIKTGVTVKLPASHVGQIWSRSGLGLKGCVIHGGVIDEDYYTREIGVLMSNLGCDDLVFKKGDKVAQLVIVEYYSEDEVDVDTVRVGGFGSTDLTTDVVKSEDLRAAAGV